MARRNSRCVSANSCTSVLLEAVPPRKVLPRKNARRNLVGPRGLRHEHGEFRDIVIPFDQRGSRSDPLNRIGVKIPCWLRDRGRMRIDENDLLRLIHFRREATQMKLPYRGRGQLVEILASVVRHIMGAKIYIAHVAKQPTSRTRDEFTQ